MTTTLSQRARRQRRERDRPMASYRTRGALVVIVMAALLLAGCSDTASPSQQGPEGGGKATPQATLDADVAPVTARMWSQMKKAQMIRAECPVQSRERLRAIAMNHYNFEGEVQRGTLVVNKDVADSVVRIFNRLFEERFPIRQMQPVETFGGDTNASLRADNTSGFNCRRPDQINAPFKESPHANGRAIDINPRENPWKDLRCKCWLPSGRERARVDGAGMILKGGTVWLAFVKEGWVWQDIKVPDYMHFDTGYPSKPFRTKNR